MMHMHKEIKYMCCLRNHLKFVTNEVINFIVTKHQLKRREGKKNVNVKFYLVVKYE